ncbi:MAG: LysM peptidoglycan-binding domain-containing protein [Treponema sp.]|nr:LysM peptidoglycan-binding domain-containing protein [Treponema sp.]
MVLFIISCQSTGQSTGKTTTGGGESISSVEAAEDDRILARIYDRYESDIILAGAKTYTVVKGDTLSRIARRHYGTGDNPYYFPLIIAASKDSVEIVDPDSIEVGMNLIIPDLEANLNDPGARGNLKNLLKDVADFYAKKETAYSRGLYNGLIKLYGVL